MGVAEVDEGAGGRVDAPAGELERRQYDPVLDEIREISAEDREAFIAYIVEHEGCTNRSACKEVGIRRRDVKALRLADKDFDEDYRTARGYGQEQVLRTMTKIGIEGVEEYVVSAGKIVTYPEGHPQAGELVTKRVIDSRATITLFNALTDDGKAAAAGKLGIDVNVDVTAGPPVQGGVSIADMAKVLVDAGVDLEALARGDEVIGELVSETDEPAAA